MFHSVYPSFLEFSEQTVLTVCRSVFVQRDYGVALRCLKDTTAARGMLCERLPSATLSCITSLIILFLFHICPLSHSYGYGVFDHIEHYMHDYQCNALAQVTLFYQQHNLSFH